MRVKVAYTVEVDDDTRREIRAYYGQDGLATREEVKQWFWLHGQTMNDDLAMQADDRAELAELVEREAVGTCDICGRSDPCHLEDCGWRTGRTR